MARYTPDYKGIRGYLQHSRELKRELYRRTSAGRGVAVALALRGDTNVLANSSEIVDDGPNGGVNRDRMQLSIHFRAKHAVPATFPRRDPTARNYLLAAVAVIQRGN